MSEAVVPCFLCGAGTSCNTGSYPAECRLPLCLKTAQYLRRPMPFVCGLSKRPASPRGQTSHGIRAPSTGNKATTVTHPTVRTTRHKKLYFGVQIILFSPKPSLPCVNYSVGGAVQDTMKYSWLIESSRYRMSHLHLHIHLVCTDDSEVADDATPRARKKCHRSR